MPVILGLLGLIAAIAIFIWRMKNAADASREIISSADDVRGKVHYWWFRRNYNKHPLQLIDDTREAAVAWMVALAQDDGVVSEAELAEIRTQMVATLGIETPVEMLARARWAVRDLRNLDFCASKLMPLLRRKLGRHERSQLLDMLEAVANADGPADDAHAAALARWRAELMRNG